MGIVRTIGTWLRGTGVAPLLVGFMRGLAEAAIMAALVAGAGYVTGHTPGDLQWLLPAIAWCFRTAEGAADHIDPTKQRAPDAPPAAP